MGVSPRPFSPGPFTEYGSPCSGFRALHSTDFIAYSQRRRGNETLLRGDREEGVPGGVLLSRGVRIRRDATFMSHVHPLLEAEDMPMNLGPGDLLPGRRQALSILRFGSLPLTHHFPFQPTAPTSAYPGHYPRRLLLRGSSSPVASGWHLLSAVTASERATGGYSVPSSHCSHP